MGAPAPTPDRGEKPHRSFDPELVGRLECVAWVSYYRREWLRFLRAVVLVTRHMFGLPWHETVLGAWLLLRANQLWAPQVDNDPDGARRAMERFYRLLQRRHGESFDPALAASLEVEWWRVHREHQRNGSDLTEESLIDALAALYAYAYGVEHEAVRQAAEQRALAMRYSDRWVSEGRDPASPLIREELAALVRSHSSLLAAVQVL
jgi:hypothetical protein